MNMKKKFFDALDNGIIIVLRAGLKFKKLLKEDPELAAMYISAAGYAIVAGKRAYKKCFAPKPEKKFDATFAVNWLRDPRTGKYISYGGPELTEYEKSRVLYEYECGHTVFESLVRARCGRK